LKGFGFFAFFGSGSFGKRLCFSGFGGGFGSCFFLCFLLGEGLSCGFGCGCLVRCYHLLKVSAVSLQPDSAERQNLCRRGCPEKAHKRINVAEFKRETLSCTKSHSLHARPKVGCICDAFETLGSIEDLAICHVLTFR